MKRKFISKPALLCLITGLLISTLTPIVNRYYPLPDAFKGFMTGLGLAVEMIALIKLQQSKQKREACSS